MKTGPYALMSAAERRAVDGDLLALRMARHSCSRSRDESMQAATTARHLHLTECHQRLMVSVAALDDAIAAFDGALFAATPPELASDARRLAESSARRNKEARGG